MRKFILLFGFVIAAMTLNAQRGAVKTLTMDTLSAATTDTSTVATISGSYNCVTFQTLSTQVGGTSDGKIELQGSVDGTSYKSVIEKAGVIVGNPVADSAIITDGAIWQVILKDAPFKKYRLIGTGTANDTTLVTITYILK